MSLPASYFNYSTDVLLLNTSSSSGTVTLPKTLSTINRVLTIKDRIGRSANSTITLQCSAGDSFEGGNQTFTVNQNYGEITLLAGADEKWYNIGGTYVLQGLVSSFYTSTVFGTGSLLSGIANDTHINSTITGLTTTYTTSANLNSTFISLSSIGGGVVTANLTSTVAGLGTANYYSTSQLTSTVAGISTFISSFVDLTEFRSTITGLGTAGYVSSATLSNALRSTVAGLTTAGYLSTLTNITTSSLTIANRANISTLTTYTLSTNATYASSIQVDNLVVTGGTNITYSVLNNSTILVNGSNFLSNYIPTSGLPSTASGLTYISTSQLTSTTGGFLNTISTNYYTTTELFSSVTGLRTAGYLSSITGGTISTLYVSTSLTASTVSLQNVSASTYFASTLRINTYVQSNVGTTYVFTAQNSSTLLINGTDVFGGFVFTSAIPSTASAQGYISTATLVSTTLGLQVYASSMIDLVEIASTVVGLGTAEYVSSTTLNVDMRSTISGLGTASYTSSPTLQSTISSFLISPISTNNFYYNSTITEDSYTTTLSGYGTSYFNGSTIFTTMPTINDSPLLTLPQFYSTVESLFAQPAVEHIQLYSF